jgi:hypothetical protein
MKEKLIVVDADGVLLNWDYAFRVWMESRGHFRVAGHEHTYSIADRFGLASKEEGKKYVTMFNESAAIGFLPALRDSVYYVKLLHEKHGYMFDVVTSLSTDKSAGLLREQNLKKIFGNQTFRNIKCLGTGASKKFYLKEHYENSGYFWIEDNPKNAEDGRDVGMVSILMEHGHNMDHESNIPVVKNWEMVYKVITSMEEKCGGLVLSVNQHEL